MLENQILGEIWNWSVLLVCLVLENIGFQPVSITGATQLKISNPKAYLGTLCFFCGFGEDGKPV